MSRVRLYLAAFVTTLLLGVPAAAQAQTGTVAGRVFDGSNMRPLSGATVQVGDRGAISGDDGRFLITNVPVGPQTVRATILGYATSETVVTVAAGQTSLIDFQLTLEALAIEGIVVTGYGQQEARDLTGVIEAVSAEEFQTGRVVSPEQLIQGKVAGVQIIDSGEPGGGVNIRIRGGTSINASNEPLFVIDGVPVAVGGGISAGRNPLNFLNPADIESVTVLKDASAAAIYGSRGANGVIIIETVGGRAGAEMTYTGSVSGSVVDGSVDLVGVNEFRSRVGEFAPASVPLLGNANTDWRGALERTALGHEHSLGITGGTDVSNYRISLGFLDQESVIDGAETERLSAALNFNQFLLNDRLKFEANIKGTRTSDALLPGGLLGNATNFAPTQPIFDDQSFTGFYEWVGSPVTVPENPLAELAFIENEGVAYRSLGGLNTEIDLPITGLTLTSNIGYDITRAENRFFAPTFLKSQEGSGNPGNVSRSNNSQTKTLFDAYLNYKLPIGETNDLEVTGGYSYENERNEFPSFFANGLSTDLLGTSGVPNNTERGSSIFVDESRLISFFGRLNYSIDGKYLFTGSIRRDGSSRFDPDESWGIFPSAAFAWRLIDEDFMADNEFFSDLKLRASWGITGNQQFANYQQYADYALGDPEAQVQFGNRFVSTIRPSAADPGVKWEETTSYNFGVDLGIMDNRFTAAIEYYFKDTDDLIFTVPVAAGTNFSNFVTTNIGSLENQGVEVTLNGMLFEAANEGDFSWDASFNMAYNSNELTVINAAGAGDEQILVGGIAGGVGSTIQVLQPGSPVNSFFTYRHIRDANGNPIYEDRNGDSTINEQDLYEDIDGDGIISQNDRVVGENPAPDFIIGQSSYMTFGNFDLSYALRAHLGQYVYNNVASDAGHFSRLQGQVPYSLHASVLDNQFVNPQYFSDVYVEDASFLRMDNITIGYRIDGMGMLDGARAFATVQNAFVFTGYSGIDPEAGIGGIDNNIFPRSRTFTAGLTIGF